MLSFRRALIVGGLSAAALCFSSAGGLAAGNPGRTPLPTPPDVVGPLCGPSIGTVVAHISVNREYIKTFTQTGGTLRFAINGFAESTVTANGKTLAFNTSGPATITVNPDGTTANVISEGHSFVIGPTGPNTGIILVTGRITVDLATGNIIVLSGHVTDVCALLAQ
jgi:hypothetical protein